VIFQGMSKKLLDCQAAATSSSSSSLAAPDSSRRPGANAGSGGQQQPQQFGAQPQKKTGKKQCHSQSAQQSKRHHTDHLAISASAKQRRGVSVTLNASSAAAATADGLCAVLDAGETCDSGLGARVVVAQPTRPILKQSPVASSPQAAAPPYSLNSPRTAANWYPNPMDPDADVWIVPGAPVQQRQIKKAAANMAMQVNSLIITELNLHRKAQLYS
jgi:hypothetical protein